MSTANVANVRQQDLRTLPGLYSQLSGLILQVRHIRDMSPTPPTNRDVAGVLLRAAEAIDHEARVLLHKILSQSGLNAPGLANQVEAAARGEHGDPLRRDPVGKMGKAAPGEHAYPPHSRFDTGL